MLHYRLYIQSLMFKTLTLVIGLCFSTAQAQEGNAFDNHTVGVSLVKPNAWRFITAEENAQKLGRVELDDKEMQDALAKYSSVPLVVLMKYPEPFDDLNPSFKVNVRPFGNLDPSNPKGVLELVLPQFQRAFPAFEVAQTPVDRDVDGIKSAYAQFRYTLRAPDGKSYPTTSEIWIVPRGRYFFMIGAGTRTDEGTGSRQEISAIMDTLRIRK
jgi:hypothetical protein